MNHLIVFLKGAAIGIANAIPGVSGGTIAVITKIFDKMMEALTLNIKKLYKNLPFLIPLGLGMAAGIFAAAKLLAYLIENHNVPTQLFFFGVVIGSMPMIYRECIKKSKLKPLDAIPFIAGISVMVLIFLFTGNENNRIYTELTPKVAAGIVITIFIAAAAMLIPGVSGSTMLKALGYYDTGMQAVNDLNIPFIALYLAGAVAGIFTIAKLISFLLNKFHKQTYCVISGLIISSLPGIFPKEFKFDFTGIIGILFMIFGIALPFLMELMQKIRKKN